MLDFLELGDVYQGELHMGSRTSPTGRSVLQSAVLKVKDHLSFLTSDRGLQNLEFSFFTLRLFSVQKFFIVLSPMLFCNGKMCSVPLHVGCMWFAFSILTLGGIQLRDCLESKKRLWTIYLFACVFACLFFCRQKFLSCLIPQPSSPKEIHRAYINYKLFILLAHAYY